MPPVKSLAALLAAAIQFDDIAARSGVRFVLDDGATPQRRLIETMVGGVALFDYDGDGRLDIYFVNGAGANRLYRNEWPRFVDVTARAGVAGGGFGMGAAAADFDNDGDQDLFVAGVHRNILYRNRGDGTFEDWTSASGLGHSGGGRKPWSVGAGWFDYDNDGWLDLFVVNYCAWDQALERPCMANGARIYCHPRHYGGLPNSLYRNNRDGTFTDVSAASGIGAHIGKGMGVAFPDFDGDGRLDILVANDTVPNFLFHNLGDGKFRETGLLAGVAYSDDGRALSSMGVDARDIDNDGLEDLFITANANETFPLFRNSGKRHWSDITYASGVGRMTMSLTGWGNGAFDFDNDGRKDLFAACGALDSNTEAFSSRTSRQPNLALWNLGGGKFARAAAAEGLGRHRGAAFGDIDGDGRVDVVVSRIGEPAEVLRNVSATGNHWLTLRLRGRRSNRDGVGAGVEVVGESGTRQWNRAVTAVGYASSSDRAVHFGLGRDRAARVEIRWPSGARQTLESVAADRLVLVEEP